MLALAQWRAEALCPLCGWPKDICQDPANEFAFTAQNTRCHITTTLRVAQKAATDGANGYLPMPFPDAVLWSAVPKPPVSPGSETPAT